MDTFRISDLRPSAFVCRTAAVAVLACAATVALKAEQPASAPDAPVFSASVASASGASPLPSFSTSEAPEVMYSSSTGAAETEAATSFITSGVSESALQPPPRRRYGRPRYADSSHNADGSNKWAFVAGVGATIATGNTKKYDKQSYAFQFGAGRTFNKKFSVLAQFDWDNFGLQGSTIANYTNLYNAAADYQTGQPGVYDIGNLDGNAHVWSFSINPLYNFYSSEGFGAYVVAGVGFYHKVTTFTVPQEACDPYGYYGCYVYNGSFDHYTSNAPGFSGGLGLTYKFSRFANERFYIEGRYVFVDSSQRYGLSTANYQTYPGTNYFPQNSNHTSYVPIKVGIRF